MNRNFFTALILGSLLATSAAAKDDARRVATGPNANLGGMRLLPADSPWHRDISEDPVDENSDRILARIGLDKPLRADFGPEWEGAPAAGKQTAARSGI